MQDFSLDNLEHHVGSQTLSTHQVPELFCYPREHDIAEMRSILTQASSAYTWHIPNDERLSSEVLRFSLAMWICHVTPRPLDLSYFIV